MNLKEIQNYPEEKRKKIFVTILIVIGIVFMIIWMYDAKNRVSNINIQGEFNYDVDKFNENIEKTKEKIYKAGDEFKEEIQAEQQSYEKEQEELDKFINQVSSTEFDNTSSTQIESTTSSYAKEEDN